MLLGDSQSERSLESILIYGGEKSHSYTKVAEYHIRQRTQHPPGSLGNQLAKYFMFSGNLNLKKITAKSLEINFQDLQNSAKNIPKDAEQSLLLSDIQRRKKDNLGNYRPVNLISLSSREILNLIRDSINEN